MHRVGVDPAQAVLSAIWAIEDDFAVDQDDPPIVLAGVLRTMLE